ncbi:MAG: FUSC family protein [Lachnospiraceae bacterium]|nr:FUSC family protein [Lachnospiraceae bacterium]
MFEQMKKIRMNPESLKGAVIPTIVVTCIFFLNYFCFGTDNTIIGPCLTLSYLYFRGMSNPFGSMIKTFLIYVSIAILAWIAGISLPLCIIVNAMALFWIVYELNDEQHPTNYYTPGMAFILFQLFPVTGSGVVTRIEAIIASFAITFFFLIILPSRKNRTTVRDYVKEGLDLSDELIQAYQMDDEDGIFLYQDRLRRKNEQISDAIYLHNYSSFRHNRRVNWYCRFVALFQVFTTLCETKGQEDRTKNMQNLLKNFKELFDGEEQYGSRTKLSFRTDRPDIRSFRLRFALRQVIIMTPCMIYAYLCLLGNGYWLPVSVFFMLVPLYENMANRVGGRLKGTLAGVVLCLVLYSVFPGIQAHIVLLIIFNFLIYSATGYATSVAYITCAILALGITPDNILFTLAERLVYTFGGAALTVFASKCIFPIRIRPEADFLYEKLIELQTQMEQLATREFADKEEERHEKDQLLIHSYLLSRRLRLYNESLRTEDQNRELMEQLNEHMMNMSFYLIRHFTGIRADVVENAEA